MSVSAVILELTEHCNRQCSYCPVSLTPRFRNRRLPTEAFERILSDLKLIDYSGSFCLNLFNEPTSDKDTLLDAIYQIRNTLPKASIYFSSNGDYLTRAYLDELFAAGLSQLSITLHIPPTSTYNDMEAISRFTAFSAKVSAPIEVTRFSPGGDLVGKLKCSHYDITVFTRNFEKFGVDRAGSMKNIEVPYTRTSPCSRPFETVTIAFDGRLFPCCQFYPDLPENGKYAVGHINDFPSIFDAYCSRRMAMWRASLFRYGPKASPCNTCLEGDKSGTVEQIREREELAQTLGVPNTNDQHNSQSLK